VGVTIESYGKFRTLMLITSNWIMIDINFDIVIGHH
jgi:hypothetical protein